MEEALHCPPTSKLSFQEQIYNVQFSPFEWSQNLICIAFSEEIAVGTVKFQVSIITNIVIYTCIKTIINNNLIK